MIGEHIEKNDDGRVVISPSGIGLWFNDSYAWFKRQVLKVKTFKGNTSTYLGHICHYKAECMTKNSDFKEDDIEAYIREGAFNPEVETDVVRAEWRDMVDVLSEYLTLNPINESEIYYSYSLNGDTKVAGTADGYRDRSIIDFKTCKTMPKEMKQEHFYQIVTYAWLRLKNTGIKSNEAEVVYIKRANSKSHPQISVMKKPITDEDYRFIEEEVIIPIRNCVEMWLKNPDLGTSLFRKNPTSFYGKE